MRVKVLWLVLCLSSFECRGIWDCLLEALTLLAHATVKKEQKNSFLVLLKRKQMQKSPPESASLYPGIHTNSASHFLFFFMSTLGKFLNPFNLLLGRRLGEKIQRRFSFATSSR